MISGGVAQQRSSCARVTHIFANAPYQWRSGASKAGNNRRAKTRITTRMSCADVTLERRSDSIAAARLAARRGGARAVRVARHILCSINARAASSRHQRRRAIIT